MFSSGQKFSSPPITGRCYCGQHHVQSNSLPQVTTYCHCKDCLRITGGPVAAFSGFSLNSLDISPDPGPSMSANPGVTRWFCRNCGTALAAHFDYLPEQVYVPLGILDQAPQLPPQMHCYGQEQMPWLKLHDDLERHTDSGADALKEAKE